MLLIDSSSHQIQNKNFKLVLTTFPDNRLQIDLKSTLYNKLNKILSILATNIEVSHAGIAVVWVAYVTFAQFYFYAFIEEIEDQVDSIVL